MSLSSSSMLKNKSLPEPESNMYLFRLALSGWAVDRASKDLGLEVGGKSDGPFGVLLPSEQQMTPCRPVSCHLSASPDRLWRVRGSEIIFLHCCSLSVSIPFCFLTSPLPASLSLTQVGEYFTYPEEVITREMYIGMEVKVVVVVCQLSICNYPPVLRNVTRLTELSLDLRTYSNVSPAMDRNICFHIVLWVRFVGNTMFAFLKRLRGGEQAPNSCISCCKPIIPWVPILILVFNQHPPPKYMRD